MKNNLTDRMRALADTGHARSVELRSAAADLDEACLGDNSRLIVKRWARARLLWRECTGEPLI